MPIELGAAKFLLVNERPYLATAIWALRDIEVKGLKTFACDKNWRLYYDPDLDWDVLTTAAVINHEIQHLLRAHFARAEIVGANTQSNTVEQTRWNIAGDMEINDDIREENLDRNRKWTLPAGVVYPDSPPFNLEANKMAEEYYGKIKIKELCGHCGSPMDGKSGSGNKGGQGSDGDDGQEKGQDGGSGSGESGDDDSGQGSGGGGEQHSDDASGQGGGNHNCPACGSEMKNPTGGNCGSAATGTYKPWEKKDSEGAVGNIEGELIRKKVAQDVNSYAQKNRGTVPGHLERWAESVLSPKVNWREALRVAVNNAMFDVAGLMDYSYARPSRRNSQASRDVVMPSMVAPTIKVAVVVDTSGSMGSNELEICLAEIKGILQSAGVRNGVTVLAVDAQVHNVQNVFNPRQVQLAGGGGTDMRVGIDRALELRPLPDIIVVLSDGYTPWPDEKPAKKVVIGLIGAESSISDAGVGSYNTPSWAKTIPIPIEDIK